MPNSLRRAGRDPRPVPRIAMSCDRAVTKVRRIGLKRALRAEAIAVRARRWPDRRDDADPARGLDLGLDRKVVGVDAAKPWLVARIASPWGWGAEDAVDRGAREVRWRWPPRIDPDGVGLGWNVSSTTALVAARCCGTTRAGARVKVAGVSPNWRRVIADPAGTRGMTVGLRAANRGLVSRVAEREG